MSSPSDGPPHKPVLPLTFNARSCGLAAAGLIVLTALAFIGASLLLPLGSLALPGPGFFPLALGIVLAILALIVAAGVPAETEAAEPVEIGHRDVLITALLLLAVPAVFETFGAYPTLWAFSVLMLVAIARTGPLTAMASSAAAMVFAWFFFQKMLGVSMPWGILTDLVNR